MGGLLTGLRQAFWTFLANRPFQLAGALSFYTLFSLAPLVLVLAGWAGIVLDEEATRQAVLDEVGRYVGAEGVEVVATIIENARQSGKGSRSMIIGLVAMLFGATTVFVQLQGALDQIWGIDPSGRRNVLWRYVSGRLRSLALVFIVGFFLLASLAATTAVTAIQTTLIADLPGAPLLWRLSDVLLTLLLFTTLIAVVFKLLPDVDLKWSDVWFGAFTTALLFALGKHFIGLYLGRTTIGSPYGAAGSLVMLLVWIYYSAIIFFFGASVTHVFSQRHGEDPDVVDETVSLEICEE